MLSNKTSAEIRTSYWAVQATAQSDSLGLWQDPDPGATAEMAQREDCYTAISRFTSIAIETTRQSLLPSRRFMTKLLERIFY
jgi:hypothetical protein